MWHGNAWMRQAAGRRVSMPPNNARHAPILDGPPNPWRNKHKKCEQTFRRLIRVGNPPDDENADFFGDLRLTVAAIQGLIAEAIRDKVTLRAVGGGWSLSEAAVTDGNMLDTLALNNAFPLDAASLIPGFRGDPAKLVYLQCGVTIDQANSLLFDRNLALKPSGAGKGTPI